MTDRGCALVTGASRGIGAAIARELACDGWPVAINFRSDRTGAEEVTDSIAAAGGQVVLVPGDLSDGGTVEEVVAATERQLGTISVLVNNAGMRVDGLSLQLTDDDWQRVLDLNLSAAFRLTRCTLRSMIRQRFGRVVNIASIIGLKANPGQANYAASKAGLIALTKTIAAEVGRRGITANAVAPGLIATDMTSDIEDAFLPFIPARRAGKPEEVASCVRFLASTEASYVNGCVITVDGGLTA